MSIRYFNQRWCVWLWVFSVLVGMSSRKLTSGEAPAQEQLKIQVIRSRIVCGQAFSESRQGGISYGTDLEIQ